MPNPNNEDLERQISDLEEESRRFRERLGGMGVTYPSPTTPLAGPLENAGARQVDQIRSIPPVNYGVTPTPPMLPQQPPQTMSMMPVASPPAARPMAPQMPLQPMAPQPMPARPMPAAMAARPMPQAPQAMPSPYPWRPGPMMPPTRRF